MRGPGFESQLEHIKKQKKAKRAKKTKNAKQLNSSMWLWCLFGLFLKINLGKTWLPRKPRISNITPVPIGLEMETPLIRVINFPFQWTWKSNIVLSDGPMAMAIGTFFRCSLKHIPPIKTGISFDVHPQRKLAISFDLHWNYWYFYWDLSLGFPWTFTDKSQDIADLFA